MSISNKATLYLAMFITACIFCSSPLLALDAQEIAEFEIENISLLSSLREAQLKLKSRGYRLKQNVRGHTLSYELRSLPPQSGFNRITLSAEDVRIIKIVWKHIDPQFQSDKHDARQSPQSNMTQLAFTLLCDPAGLYPDECRSKETYTSSSGQFLELHAKRYTRQGTQYRAEFQAVPGMTSWTLQFIP